MTLGIIETFDSYGNEMRFMIVLLESLVCCCCSFLWQEEDTNRTW